MAPKCQKKFEHQVEKSPSVKGKSGNLEVSLLFYKMNADMLPKTIPVEFLLFPFIDDVV